MTTKWQKRISFYFLIMSALSLLTLAYLVFTKGDGISTGPYYPIWLYVITVGVMIGSFLASEFIPYLFTDQKEITEKTFKKYQNGGC
jgi:hypothetical protein